MSEFWGFHAIRNSKEITDADLRTRLTKLRVKDAFIDRRGGWIYVVSNGKVEKLADLVVQFFDHESAAWDFSVWVKGKRVGGGTFGENEETGAADEGFDGDLDATAAALGVPAKKLEKTFASEVSKGFLKLLGLELAFGGPGDVKKGMGLVFGGPRDDGDDDD